MVSIVVCTPLHSRSLWVFGGKLLLKSVHSLLMGKSGEWLIFVHSKFQLLLKTLVPCILHFSPFGRAEEQSWWCLSSVISSRTIRSLADMKKQREKLERTSVGVLFSAHRGSKNRYYKLKSTEWLVGNHKQSPRTNVPCKKCLTNSRAVIKLRGRQDP